MSADSRIPALIELARGQLQLGLPAKAAESLNGVLALDPENVEALALLGACFLEQDQIRAAQEAVHQALKLDPQAPLALHMTARTMIACKRFVPAERMLEALLQVQPEEALVWSDLAGLYEQTGRSEAALRALEKAREIDPTAPDTLRALGIWHLHRGDLAQAEAIAREGLRVEADNPSLLLLMGHVLLHRGRVEEAREHAVAVLQSNPGNRDALHLMVSIKARTHFFLGLWWRYSVLLGMLGRFNSFIRVSALMVALFALLTLSNTAIDLADKQGYAGLSLLIGIVGIFCASHFFVGRAIFDWMLRRELSQYRLKRSF
jgi:Flp pilus assembly protein TadD